MGLASASVDQDVNKAAVSFQKPSAVFSSRYLVFLLFTLLNMACISCRSLCRGAVSILWWLLVLASFIVPMCLVGYVLIPAFSPPSGIVRHELTAEYLSSNKVWTPLWPDDFDYGLKVYSSFESDAVRNTTKFFESAQLLWHVDSVSASNKYPKFASSVKVDIPDMLYSADNRSSTLYAHIFIQAADNLLPYPNIYDKYLVYSTTKLVYWRPIVKSDNNTNDTSPEYELVAATKIPWAIYLENYVYTGMMVPAYISKATDSIYEDSKAGYTYKPPVFENRITENVGKARQLALLYSNGTLVSDFDSTASVQLKLQGVWRGWIKLRGKLDGWFKPTNFTYEYVSVDSEPKRWEQVPKTPGVLETEIYPLVYKQSIVSIITACVLYICSLPMTLIYLKMSIAFWLGPKSKWDGVSRATFVMQSAYMFVKVARVCFAQSNVLAYIIWMFCALPFLQIMIELPYNPLQWSGYITDKIALYKQASTHNIHSGTDNDKAVQLITTIRRNVDYTACKWIGLVYPPIFIVITLHALAYNTDGIWGVFEQVVVRSYSVLVCICFVPQIILNHKARSGSLIPPALYICSLCATVLFLGSKYSIGLLDNSLLGIDDLILIASYIVFIIQWILYR